MLKIYGKSSSINVRKVLWTCDEVGLEFEREDWGSGFRSTMTPEFLALNPNGMVPVITDGEFVLWESNAICRYICARQGRTDLLAAEPKARAQIEQWMDWQAGEFNNSWRYAFMALVRKSAEHTDPLAIQASIANWNKHVGILDQHLLSGRLFVMGETITVADIVLGLSIHRWFMAPMQRPEYSAVNAYYQRLRERPAFLKYATNEVP
jgi:glutathione S-transferase